MAVASAWAWWLRLRQRRWQHERARTHPLHSVACQVPRSQRLARRAGVPHSVLQRAPVVRLRAAHVALGSVGQALVAQRQDATIAMGQAAVLLVEENGVLVVTPEVRRHALRHARARCGHAGLHARAAWACAPCSCGRWLAPARRRTPRTASRTLHTPACQHAEQRARARAPSTRRCELAPGPPWRGHTRPRCPAAPPHSSAHAPP